MTDTLTHIEFRPLVIPESVDADERRRLPRDGARPQHRLPRDLRPRRRLRARRRTPAQPQARRLPAARRVGRRRQRPHRRPCHARAAVRERVEARLLADRTAPRGVGPRHRIGRLRARRADRPRARPHDPAGVGRASRRTRAPDRRPDGLRRDPRGSRRHGSSSTTATRSSRWSATAPSTSSASFETVERLLAEAEAASADYRVVQWFAPTPPEYVDGYAWMKSRMITDAPSADLEFDEEVWDAARLAQHDAKYTDVGRLMQVTAAQHIAYRRARRIQRARHRQGPHRGDVSGGHARPQRAPRAQARNARQVRRTARVARHRARLTARDHLQRRGEPPHARHQ